MRCAKVICTAAVLLVLAFLCGCSQREVAPHPAPAVPYPEAQEAIALAHLDIAQTARMVRDEFMAGRSCDEEHEYRVMQLRIYAADIDKAQSLLDAGNEEEALRDAKVAQILIQTLRRAVETDYRK